MDHRLYCCYSLNLRNYLRDHGIKYEVCGLNPNNQKMFWVYFQSEELSKLLSQWSNQEG